MKHQNQPSREQLEIQARISQRQIETIQKILSSGVQAPKSQTMDKDAEVVIARLYDTSLSDTDISSCISILEMLLIPEALPPLLNVMKSESYGMSLRTQAAAAIAQIGSSGIANELTELHRSASPELRSLTQIALKQ